MKIKLLLIFTLVALALSVPAKATDVDLLQFTNGFLGVPCPSGGCGSVTIDDSVSGQVTLTVSSLLNGFQFDTFGFNTSGSINNFSSSGAVNTGDSHYNLFQTGGQQDGFGDFKYLFNTGVNGGSTGTNCSGNPGSPSAGCTFSLVLKGTNLTANFLETPSTGGAGDGNAEFAGHLANGSQCTGFVGGDNTGLSNGTSTNSNCVPAVPEPSSLVLFGGGLLGLAAFIRRRPNLWAAMWTARA